MRDDAAPRARENALMPMHVAAAEAGEAYIAADAGMSGRTTNSADEGRVATPMRLRFAVRVSSGKGAPRSVKAAPRQKPGMPGREAASGQLVSSTTGELLDYFAKCPQCGYTAEASETVRTFSSGMVERMLFRTCGLPCGWLEPSSIWCRGTSTGVPIPASPPSIACGCGDGERAGVSCPACRETPTETGGRRA